MSSRVTRSSLSKKTSQTSTPVKPIKLKIDKSMGSPLLDPLVKALEATVKPVEAPAVEPVVETPMDEPVEAPMDEPVEAEHVDIAMLLDEEPENPETEKPKPLDSTYPPAGFVYPTVEEHHEQVKLGFESYKAWYLERFGLDGDDYINNGIACVYNEMNHDMKSSRHIEKKAEWQKTRAELEIPKDLEVAIQDKKAELLKWKGKLEDGSIDKEFEISMMAAQKEMEKKEAKKSTETDKNRLQYIADDIEEIRQEIDRLQNHKTEQKKNYMAEVEKRQQELIELELAYNKLAHLFDKPIVPRMVTSRVDLQSRKRKSAAKPAAKPASNKPVPGHHENAESMTMQQLVDTWEPRGPVKAPPVSYPPRLPSKSSALAIPEDVIDAMKAKMDALVTNSAAGQVVERKCNCQKCAKRVKDRLDPFPDHGQNYKITSAVVVLCRDKDTHELKVQGHMVEHYVQPSKMANGPLPLGAASSTKVYRSMYPGGPPTTKDRTKLAEIMADCNMSLFPSYQLSPSPIPEEHKENHELLCNKTYWTEKLQRLTERLGSDEAKRQITAKKKDLAEPIKQFYLAKGKEEGFLNQFVVFQKPAMVDEEWNPEHKGFFLVPACFCWDGMTTFSDKLPEYKKSCFIASRDRLPRDACMAMFGDYGADEIPMPTSAYVENGRVRYAFGTLWYPDEQSSWRHDRSKMNEAGPSKRPAL